MAAQIQQHRNIIVIPRDIYQKCTEDMPIPRTRLLRGRDAATRKRLLNAPDCNVSRQGYAQHGATIPAPTSSRPTTNDLLAAPSHASNDEIFMTNKKLKVEKNQVRSPSPQKPAREVIVISSDDEADEEAPTSKYTAATAASATEGHHKYDLDPALRRVVDTIFPAFESHNKATLERAFATSRILRENYIVTRYLGSGASGFVLAAKREFDGREVAIKVIPHTGDHVEQKVQRELGILLRLKEHENVLSFYDHFTSSLYGDIDPDDQSNKDISYIVTEMAGFSLFDFIELHKPVQDEDASTRSKNIQELPRSATSPPSIYGSAIQEDALRSIFTQLALALHSLHSQNIVHGDVKDENALISVDRATNTYRAKLCDFGHSKYLQPGSSPCFSFYGTTILAPPEMDNNVAARQKSKEPNRRTGNQSTTWDLFYGYEADVWALGLTLYTMIHGDLPKELYETGKKLAAYKRKRASHRMFPFTLQENIDSDLKDLLKNMLAVDPTRRLTMSEVINHRWMLRKPL
ncbi:hypothetical protein BGZ79_007139 [Entomortierella chlamydospora]|nr:hypothetical protein BGZ79_007139 [Entomortierella chlamydospora]